jgi:uncharacterized protein YdaU (DUF1376 family)
MAQFPGLMLWTDSWVADTAHLTRLERGTYHDLLVLMWRTPGCRVPNDNAWLAKHMRMSPEEISQELRAIISEFCQSDGHWIFQKRLQKEFLRSHELSARQSFRVGQRWGTEKAKQKAAKRAEKAAVLAGQHETNRHKLLFLKGKDGYLPDQISKIESYCSRAREDDEPEQAVAEKKAGKISAELYHLVAAKRSTSEE